MHSDGAFPWSGFLIAIVATIGMAVAGVAVWLALIILIVWGGTLWLVAATPPEIDESASRLVSIEDRFGDLIEEAGSPLILARADRVLVANREARKVLGAHIVQQDLRMAIRSPEALKLFNRKREGAVLVRGLKRRNDIWQVSRKDLGEDIAIIELIDRTESDSISRAHTDFVANASHELRTPLASIIGYVETLRDEDAAEDAQLRDKFLGTIQKEATRMQSLVSDLMSLSRIEAEKHEAPDELIALAEATERAAIDAAGLERRDRLQLELDSNARVKGDERQIEQVIRNIVDNAFKYGSDDGAVSVSLTVENNRKAVLCVKDEGEGIPKEHIPMLTRRFYRTDPGRSRASGGTGLGLAIVKHIVERHSGRLTIKSKIGEGTQVNIAFPLAR